MRCKQRPTSISAKSVIDKAHNIYSPSSDGHLIKYNGEAEENEQYEIRLSEAFANKEVEADAELVVHVYNVNAGHNEDLMNKCKTLY